MNPDEQEKKKALKEKWEEIIATANNQDPKYSFELFEGLILEKNKQLDDFAEKLKEEFLITLSLDLCDEEERNELIDKILEEVKGQ